MTQTPIEIYGNLYFSQIWDGETSSHLHTLSNVKILIFHRKMFGDVNIILISYPTIVSLSVLKSLLCYEFFRRLHL